MRAPVALFFLISAVSYSAVTAEIEDRLKEDFFCIYTHTALKLRNVTDEPVTENKIKYFLFTKANVKNYTEIDPRNPEEFENVTGQIVFIIHGWTENRERQWYEDLKNAFLNRLEEYYVVQVDWSDPANQFYTISSWNTKEVGNIIGEFIAGLHTNYSISLQQFLIVGHSLGGQVSGYIGKKVQEVTGRKLPRLIALDPAGPLFISRPEEERLNKNDAEVVHVIHTDGGTFGFKPSCGTIDFFPNGGNHQPGCSRIDLLDISSVSDAISCDHHRSWQYFIEAVLNPDNFEATKCSGWAKFKTNFCDDIEVNMGDLKTRETGDFYLNTNGDKPYGRKTDGFGVNEVLSVPSKVF